MGTAIEEYGFFLGLGGGGGGDRFVSRRGHENPRVWGSAVFGNWSDGGVREGDLNGVMKRLESAACGGCCGGREN